jgi:hypothetical protein
MDLDQEFESVHGARSAIADGTTKHYFPFIDGVYTPILRW